MSRLSTALKALINAPHARPGTTAAPADIHSVYARIAADAAGKRVGLPAWLCASTAATMTLNSPDAMLELYRLAVRQDPAATIAREDHALWVAEMMREVGLKCLGFNGIPRTINMLGAFYGGLPQDVQTGLDRRKPQRELTPSTLNPTLDRGQHLWNSIYNPFSSKLVAKLAQSHPDLPIHIIEAGYGNLFSDPPSPTTPTRANVGRVLTSIVAVACLRAQTGVGPQVLSHVFGLRKAFDDGTAEPEDAVPGGKWLASDDGSVWLLEVVDRVVEAIKGPVSASQDSRPVLSKL